MPYQQLLNHALTVIHIVLLAGWCNESLRRSVSGVSRGSPASDEPFHDRGEDITDRTFCALRAQRPRDDERYLLIGSPRGVSTVLTVWRRTCPEVFQLELAFFSWLILSGFDFATSSSLSVLRSERTSNRELLNRSRSPI